MLIHCWRCRKHSGSSFGTTVGVRSEDFVFVSGEDLIASWESSPGIHRFFASCCGSPIFKKPDDLRGSFVLSDVGAAASRGSFTGDACSLRISPPYYSNAVDVGRQQSCVEPTRRPIRIEDADR